MESAQLEKWRNEVLSLLEALKVRARQIRQFMDARDLQKLEDKADFEAAWQQVQDLLPEDLHPNRAGDLNRHIHFGSSNFVFDHRKCVSNDETHKPRRVAQKAT